MSPSASCVRNCSNETRDLSLVYSALAKKPAIELSKIRQNSVDELMLSLVVGEGEVMNKEWSQSPRNLIEQMVWTSVANGAETRPVDWKGATKEPFLTLEAEGATKREHVTRLASGGKVTVHVWINLEGVRNHLKIKTT